MTDTSSGSWRSREAMLGERPAAALAGEVGLRVGSGEAAVSPVLRRLRSESRGRSARIPPAGSSRRGRRAGRRRAGGSRRATARRRCAGRASRRGRWVAPAGQRGLDGEPLHVDVGLHQRGEVARERADRPAARCRGRGHARHLDAAVGRQVVDQQPVRRRRLGTLPLNANGVAGLARADDVRAVLGAALDARSATVALELGRAAPPTRRSAPRSGAGTRPAGC